MGNQTFTYIKPEKLSPEELAQLSHLSSSALDMIAAWANKKLTCAHCKRCTLRCDILKEANLDIGLVEEAYQNIMHLDFDKQPAAVLDLVQQQPKMYNALRKCCFCGYCTAPCQTHMTAPDRMRAWRLLFLRAGLMPPDDSRLVMVDNEWHIFSAYRAIYGIGYPDFLSLEDAAAQGPGTVDTLFFPGCSLASYAPELTHAVGSWLTQAGVSWALSTDCCGSPLMSAGLFERAQHLRSRIVENMRSAGITRMVTICPGCSDEFAEDVGNDIEIVPLPELLLEKSIASCKEGGTAPAFTPLDTSSLTFFDSCHDRVDNRNAHAIRHLMTRTLPRAPHYEMDHRKKGTLCCGAGGAVAAYDSDITQKRVWRIIEEARKTKAQTLVTMCPTCTYTIAQACLEAADANTIESYHYLEILFGQRIDWAHVFEQLGSMWTGEYGPWLTQTFFS